ncbi:Elongation factor 1-gamma 1 [Yarrowia sp. C11]|nr:Elongation factor 1-gamma 1 [Yarrowia sp. E02]KAG5365079.1 Elongation factor 1-gamma 1 [Yarrowia sp. C11]
MSIGKLYDAPSCRVTPLKALIKHFKLDVDIVQRDAQFGKLFPLKKVPAFVAADGTPIHEFIAISYYLLSQIPNNPLAPKTKEDEAEVLQWVSFANQEVLGAAWDTFGPLTGRVTYNKESVDAASAQLDKLISLTYEPHLTKNTYLVGEKVTYADVSNVALLSRGFEYLFDDAWKKKHPATTRWWLTVSKNAIFSGFDLPVTSERIQYTPKKEEPKKEAKKEAAPKAAASEEAPAPKKAAHPLAALGPAKEPIDNWKRVYSNEDTREKAIPWFWEHYDPEDYSLWKVKYKYDDELTLTFMSTNLIGGFVNRLTASTKYMFGTAVVYGTNNDNGIIGAFMIRGQDHVAAFDVAPDWESYDFSKLDPSNPEDKEFVDNMWAWDKPVVTASGESKEIVDGAVLK